MPTLTKNNAKKIRNLKIKKYRLRYHEFIAEGDKIVKELIFSDYQITQLYATSAWIKKNCNILPGYLKPVKLSLEELRSISHQVTPNQVLAVVKIPGKKELHSPENQLTLLIDNLQDPGNLGTIIRTAEWFGIKNIICSEDTVDIYNPKVIQATMGSFCRVETYYTNLTDYLKNCIDKIPVYGSYLHGQNCFNLNFEKNGILVIGNESKGISPENEKFITTKVTIPAYEKEQFKKPDSLNASAAASILMALIRMNDL